MDTIRQKCKEKTLIFITHDIKEAVHLADRIVIIKNGKLDFDIINDGQKERLEKILFEQMLK